MYPPTFDDDVAVVPWGVPSSAHLTVPTEARGIVVDAHVGSRARRDSFVDQLGSSKLAPLSVDLLSDGEHQGEDRATDVQLLAVRLLAATRWLRRLPVCADLQVGYLGSGSAGAAAAWAASEDRDVAAVVSRDGRLELASARLPAVFAPTLLVVAATDPKLRLLNEQCGRRLRCEHRVVLLPVPRHPDEEEMLATGDRLARDWFVEHVVRERAG